MDFPLAELDPHDGPGRSFIEGTIVQGHFERGGTPNVTNAVTEVLQVVHFRKLLEREPAQDAELSYLCFGAPTGFTVFTVPGSPPRRVQGTFNTPRGRVLLHAHGSAIRWLRGRPRHSGRHP